MQGSYHMMSYNQKLYAYTSRVSFVWCSIYRKNEADKKLSEIIRHGTGPFQPHTNFCNFCDIRRKRLRTRIEEKLILT